MGELKPRIDGGKYVYFDVTVRDNIDIIRFNRPEKKNAISPDMWKELVQIFQESGKSDSAITVITGTGEYFTSGADLQNIKVPSQLQGGLNPIKTTIDLLIDYPKPLIAVVNGPAVGFGVTLLGLCDGVYATEKATFLAPFTQLGWCVEACSSYTFPRIMGNNLAADLLLFGNKITATEAHKRGLVTKVFPDHSFEKEVWVELFRIAALPKGSMRDSKKIIRDIDRELLHSLNATELAVVAKRLLSEEHKEAIKKFMSKKSKI